jgi:hypothetical protein
MRWFLSLLLFSLASFALAQQRLGRDAALEARAKAHDERYGPTFYGIEIPETGARVLLIIDASGSMQQRDTLRSDGGSRWQTLIDEVSSMTQQMADLQKANPRLCYTVSILYEVFRYEKNEKAHKGTPPFDLSQPNARTALIEELQSTTPGGGANFNVTFNETLWPLVAKQHITHIFFLGDNDIDVYGEAIEATFRRWYAVTPKEPKAAKERQLWRLKKTWFEPWKKWRPPSARRTLALRSSETLRLPPPPKEVTFSAIAIGASSPLLETFTTLARGTYVERN